MSQNLVALNVFKKLETSVLCLPTSFPEMLSRYYAAYPCDRKVVTSSSCVVLPLTKLQQGEDDFLTWKDLGSKISTKIN